MSSINFVPFFGLRQRFSMGHSCWSRAGGPIIDEANSDLIRVPPLSVPLRQRIVEKLTKEGDGETKRVSQLERELLAVTAKANDDTLDLVCFDVLTMSESASSGEFYHLQDFLHENNCVSTQQLNPFGFLVSPNET